MFKRLSTTLKLLDSLQFANSKAKTTTQAHLKPNTDFNSSYLKQILNHNLSQLKAIAIADKDKLIIELIQLEEKMIAKLG